MNSISFLERKNILFMENNLKNVSILDKKGDFMKLIVVGIVEFFRGLFMQFLRIFLIKFRVNSRSKMMKFFFGDF